MKFPYQPVIIAAPDSVDYLLILRPEIPVTIIGDSDESEIIGLVDTGSDNTILPRSIADGLGIPLRAAEGADAITFGGKRVRLLSGEVLLELRLEENVIRWRADVCFHEFPSDQEETAILGHAGFLNYFTATFDGLEGLLTLAPNIELPAC